MGNPERMELNVRAEEVVGIEVAGRKWGCLTWFDLVRQGHGVNDGGCWSRRG